MELHEGQAGFRLNKSCVHQILQGRLKRMYSFFFDMQKAYDTVMVEALEHRGER